MRSSWRVVYAPQPLLLLQVLVWWTTRCCCFAHSFPLDLFNEMLATTARDEFGKDDEGFNNAIDWQTRRVSSSGVAAPFVGCADYNDGRQLRVHLEQVFGVDSVSTVHHSRQHGASCFIFHALREEAEQLLRGGDNNVGTGQLQQLAAFPANLKISPTVLDYSAAATSSARTRTRRSVAATYSDRQGFRRLPIQPRGTPPTPRGTPSRERLAAKLEKRIHDGQYNLQAPLTLGGKGLTTTKGMHKKIRFYSSHSTQVGNIESNVVGAEDFNSKTSSSPINADGGGGEASSDLRIKPHPHMHISRSRGLGLQLSPGALGPLPWPTGTAQKGDIGVQHAMSTDDDTTLKELVDGWRESWISPNMDVHRLSMWSDPEAGFQVSDGEGDVVQKMFRSSEWSRAAGKLAQMRGDALDGGGLGKTCGWDMAVFSHETADYITVMGIDHLLDGHHLPERSEWTQDRRVACFMGLLSVFSSAHEVLRIAPLPRARTHNAVASAITQSGTITREPFHDADLDGTGEVVQVVDTGLDELSCFFVDRTGEIEHSTIQDPVSDLKRRKVVQYIEYGDGDAQDADAGHGTHVASSIAGEVLPEWEAVQCPQGDQKDCFGVCQDAQDMDTKAGDWVFDVSLYCEALNCDGGWLYLQVPPACLEDGPADAPFNARGVASGAKVALFDVSGEDDGGALDVPFPDARPMWLAAASTGAAIHSNSWGYSGCVVNEGAYYSDKYLYDHEKQILLFAAGNSGGQGSPDSCSVDSPATSKNAVAVGSSASGVTRFSPSRTIDEVSYFSGRGPLEDGRIKPDVVAPGDMVISARSAGYDGGGTCEVDVKDGTSMSNAVAAGAVAIVRQYFRTGWYTADVTARGLCSAGMFHCEAAGTFTPSGALLKAVLVHGADSMGGLSSPDGDKGFGRVFLEDVLPIRGEGATTMYFDDEAVVEAGRTIDYIVTVADSTVELRVTLVWMDPPVLSFAGRQLLHDLDLVVLPSASGSSPIFSNGLTSCCDMVNNVERVVVPVETASAVTTETKEYTIRIMAYQLIEADQQAFSLIISGGSLNVISVSTVDTTDDYLFGKTTSPTPAPIISQLDEDNTAGDDVGNCSVPDSYGWAGDGWCDGIMNTEECLWDGGDCCVNTCVDGVYDCDRSIFDCQDPGSVFSHFCDIISDEDQSGAAGDSADEITIASETRAHVCANCNPFMENFFHTIGDGVCDSWANVDTCAFDGGDCCPDKCQHIECSGASEDTCFDPSSSLSFCGSLDKLDPLYEVHDQLCRECSSFASDLGSFIGDGFCDKSLDYNSASCLFDGGDCCLDTCKDSLWVCPADNSDDAYVCLDPSSSEYLCDHLLNATSGAESLCETCAEYMDSADRFEIGDGHCDDDKNIEGCLWDGGDCCQSSCQPDSPLFIQHASTAAPASSPTASPRIPVRAPLWSTESSLTSSSTRTAAPTYDWSEDDFSLDPNAPACDREKSASSVFDCFDCGGEAQMYLNGQVVCLDPYSPEYVCAQGASATQIALCESCDRRFASDWYLVGNGGCQSWLNNEGCLWDGGDCCESTCIEGEELIGQLCGILGYNCLAPGAE